MQCFCLLTDEVWYGNDDVLVLWTSIDPVFYGIKNDYYNDKSDKDDDAYRSVYGVWIMFVL